MNQLVTATILLLFAPIFASAEGTGPKVYGLINKEIRSVSQDKDSNKKSSPQVTDVDGFETRLGATGTEKLEHFDVTYKIELGLNSNKDTSDESRIRMRLAYVSLQKDFGNIVIGQNWTPNSVRMIKLDPLTATGLQNYSLDQGFVNGKNAGAGGLGFRMRYFVDQLTYATPNFSGFQYQITYDTNDTSASFDKTSGTPPSADNKTYLSHVLTYDKMFGEWGINLTGTYSQASHEKQISTHQEKFWTVANKLIISNFELGMAYGIQSTGDKGDNTRMFVSGKYKFNNYDFAVTYGNLDVEDGTTGVKTGSDNMIATGAIYHYSKDFSMRLLLGRYGVKKETAADFDGDGQTEKENSAKIITVGTTINF